LVHILAAGQAKTRQYGVAWNTGPRDADVPPPGPVAGRLIRAQGNFFETFPIAAAPLLLAGLLPLGSGTTALGAALWLGARLLYLPLWVAGVPVVRSLVSSVSLLGMLLVLWPALMAAF